MCDIPCQTKQHMQYIQHKIRMYVWYMQNTHIFAPFAPFLPLYEDPAYHFCFLKIL
jgi:hypothetical protein